MKSWVCFGEHLLPTVLCHHIGTLDGTNHLVVLIECGALKLTGMALAQRVSIEPGLDGRTTHTVHDDALRHSRFLEHFTSQEVTYSREQPCVVFCHRFPVDGSRSDILLRTVCVGISLYTEHTNLRIGVVVDDLPVLWIDPLNGYVDVRLS